MPTPAPISADQIAYRKKVGKLGDDQIFEIGLIGGLHLIAKAQPGGKSEILGAGPHRAVARHIAQKRNPDIRWTELSKSDHIEPEFFEFLLPAYEAMTDTLVRLQGE
jgi:hypothetical protein